MARNEEGPRILAKGCADGARFGVRSSDSRGQLTIRRGLARTHLESRLVNGALKGRDAPPGIGKMGKILEVPGKVTLDPSENCDNPRRRHLIARPVSGWQRESRNLFLVPRNGARTNRRLKAGRWHTSEMSLQRRKTSSRHFDPSGELPRFVELTATFLVRKTQDLQ